MVGHDLYPLPFVKASIRPPGGKKKPGDKNSSFSSCCGRNITSGEGMVESGILYSQYSQSFRAPGIPPRMDLREPTEDFKCNSDQGYHRTKTRDVCHRPAASLLYPAWGAT